MSSYFKQCLGQVRQTSSSQSIHHTTQVLNRWSHFDLSVSHHWSQKWRSASTLGRIKTTMFHAWSYNSKHYSLINLERHLNPLWWPISFSSIAHKLDLFEISNPKGLICCQNIPYLRCDETRVHLSQQSYVRYVGSKYENWEYIRCCNFSVTYITQLLLTRETNELTMTCTRGKR